jgi:predicted nucleotidyltransferase
LYGSPTPDSDIDLLIIMETSESLTERILAVSRLLRPRPFPMDILVRTPQEISALLEDGDGFFQEIMTQGKIIYDRRS